MLGEAMLKIDPTSPKAAALAEALSEHMDPGALPEDLCLVIGGDGYLLSVIAQLGSDWTYLGLNSGSLGFMLNDVEELESSADLLAKGAWKV